MSNLAVTPGSGALVATIDVTRDTVTEKIQVLSTAIDTGSIFTTQISVTTAIQLTTGSPSFGRRLVRVVNTDPTNAVVVGPAGVAVGTGIPIQPGTYMDFPLGANTGSPMALFGIASSGTVIVAIMEIG